jgi:hypothetical protein
MNEKQRKVLIGTVVISGGLLAQYLSYSEQLRPIHEGWISLAILAAFVGASAFIWLGEKR